MEIPSRKYEHACLYGRLVTEWLGDFNDTPLTSGDSGDPFEHVGRKEMHDQRNEWESRVFDTSSKSDPAAIEAYLGKLFDSTSKSKKLSQTPLDTMRESMKTFHPGTLTVDALKVCITAILTTDLLFEAKKIALRDFHNNPTVLQEMADVLNIQLDELDSWSWGDEAVSIEVRRSLNGKYRVYMDEEIMQAVLLHFVGMKWAVHFKTVFTTFFHSGAWQQSTRNPMDGATRLRRRDYELADWQDSNVRNQRRDRYMSDYFMSQLPSSFEDAHDEYSGETHFEEGEAKNAMAVKQSLLHLISAEMAINTRLHGSFTIVQSDFRWFGPSLPHSTIITVLRFFGLSARWLRFIETFLAAPLKFVHDGPNAQTQVRRCGVPIQHRLADALGEAVLFCLDFAVNKSTQSNLHRMHDDLWFWGSSDASIKAWQSIQEFTTVMGLTLNMDKTGSANVLRDAKSMSGGASDKLPQGQIRWGFLILDSSGKWIIDDQIVEQHVPKLQTQLKACKSIFTWVQAWNVYLTRFIANNFGEPATCLGRSHIDMVIDAFKKIQRKLFDTDELPGSTVTEHLRGKVAARFGVADVLDGFFYFPVEVGGLGLRNPFLPLLLLRNGSPDNPMEHIDRALEFEEEAYNKAKKQYEDGTRRSSKKSKTDPFLSLEEYTRHLEETSAALYNAYGELLSVPEPVDVTTTSDMRDARAETAWFAYPGPYDKWLLELYGHGVVRRFGGLSMGEGRLLPLGLIDLLQKEKMKWEA